MGKRTNIAKREHDQKQSFKQEHFRSFVSKDLCSLVQRNYHYENMSIQYIEIIFSCKNQKFHRKNFDIFSQNIDCGSSLEPPC